MDAQRIAAMSIAQLVATCNDNVDPFDFKMPFIKDNEDEVLDDIAEVMGGSWLVKAIRNGHYDPADRYILALEDQDQVVTFTTRTEFFQRVATPEDLAECWPD